MARLTSLVLASSLFGAFGCNAIFGINDGKLADGGGNAGGGNQGGQNAGGGPGGNNSGGSNVGGDGGGGNVPFDPCVPTTFTDGDTSQQIDPGCGLFVDPNNANAGTGTKADPYQSLQAALDAHGAGVPIYIAGAGSLSGSFTTTRGGAIYGGLTSSFSRDSSLRPSLLSDPSVSSVALILQLNPQENMLLDSLVILGGDKSTDIDGTSIAVLVQGGNLRVRNCQVVGGNAGRGHDGATGEAGEAGVPGQGTNSSCNAGVTYKGGLKTCSDGATIDGGDGAMCSSSSSQAGQFGKGPNPGPGGNGLCTPGNPGGAGMDGMPGMRGPEVGDFGGMGGNIIGEAPRAPDGVPGSGGGGGGARIGFNGAGGGSGGCAGRGGGGGGNGGMSAAIGAFDANIDVVDSKLQASPAGSGGRGGGGGPSGPKGTGGSTTAPGQGCAGGDGGDGGNGGAAAGGNGGVSSLIVHFKGDVTIDTASISNSQNGLPSSPAQGGPGGSFPTQAPGGNPGLLCARLVFDGSGGHQCLASF